MLVFLLFKYKKPCVTSKQLSHPIPKQYFLSFVRDKQGNKKVDLIIVIIWLMLTASAPKFSHKDASFVFLNYEIILNLKCQPVITFLFWLDFKRKKNIKLFLKKI